MPLVSGNYDPAVGIIIQVAVLTPADLMQIQEGQQPEQMNMAMGLVDTGASITCISRATAESVGLVPSGKTTMNGSTGQSAVDQYTFGVGFLFGAQQNPTGTVSGQLNLHLVQGCEFVNHGFGFDLLIGRDIICKGGLGMTFDGHFHLAF